jgi:hypothetical protein
VAGSRVRDEAEIDAACGGLFGRAARVTLKGTVPARHSVFENKLPGMPRAGKSNLILKIIT